MKPKIVGYIVALQTVGGEVVPGSFLDDSVWNGGISAHLFKTRGAATKAITHTIQYSRKRNFGWKREQYKIWSIKK